MPLHKFYIVYKTTNLINGKFYIGKHCSNVLNDDYLGSGDLQQISNVWSEAHSTNKR